MTIQAHLHDGTVLEFPDGTDEAVITRTVQGLMAQPKDKMLPRGSAESKLAATDNHSFIENLFGGLGNGIAKKGMAVGEYAGLVSPQDVDAYREANKQLDSTAGGTIGNMVSDVGLNMLGGVGLKAIAGAKALSAPIAKTLGYVGDSLVMPKNVAQGATGGAVSGLLQERGTDDSALGNAGIGGLLGTVIPGISTAAKLGKRALLDTLLPSGNDKLAGAVLREVSTNPAAVQQALENPKIILPGSQPNIAEASGDPGLATYLSILRSRDPMGSGAKTQLNQLRQSNDQARIAALEGLTKGSPAQRTDLMIPGTLGNTGSDIADQIAYRQALTGKLYEAGAAQPVKITTELAELLATPTGQKAVARANRLAADMELPGAKEGRFIPDNAQEISGQGLHIIKQALNDIRNSQAEGGLSKFERGIVDQLTTKLKTFMPEPMKEADKLFAEASKPISQMQVRDALLDKQNAVMQGSNSASLYPTAYASALRNEDKLARDATGWERSKGLADFMTPDQMGTLEAIRQDMARQMATDKLGSAMGSPTGQNIHGDRIVRGLLDDVGLPQNWSKAASDWMQSVGPLRKALDVADMGVNRRMGRAAVDPAYALQLMRLKAMGNPFLGGLDYATRLGAAALPAGLLSYESSQ